MLFDLDEQDPTDVAYVFSGYAPLSVRLVQCAVGRGGSITGWKGIEDVLKALPGATFDDVQAFDDSHHARSELRFLIASQTHPDFRAADTSTQGQLPTTVVCYLGGITYAEIAALRFLNRQTPRASLNPSPVSRELISAFQSATC